MTIEELTCRWNVIVRLHKECQGEIEARYCRNYNPFTGMRQCAFHISASGKMPKKDIFVSLGANTQGCWGAPPVTLCRSLQELERCGVNIVACSPLYQTQPHTHAGLMPAFYNAVAALRTDMAIGSFLRLLKNLEHRAGRRASPRWSRRPLDLDIIDYGGRVVNWPALTAAGGPIVLPHPLMHQRGFVLVPLAEIAPNWRHPVLGMSAANLLRRTPGLRRGIIRVDRFATSDAESPCVSNSGSVAVPA